jgi:hypothetical protein
VSARPRERAIGLHGMGSEIEDARHQKGTPPLLEGPIIAAGLGAGQQAGANRLLSTRERNAGEKHGYGATGGVSARRPSWG